LMVETNVTLVMKSRDLTKAGSFFSFFSKWGINTLASASYDAHNCFIAKVSVSCRRVYGSFFSGVYIFVASSPFLDHANGRSPWSPSYTTCLYLWLLVVH
jgi:hypothetical protein